MKAIRKIPAKPIKLSSASDTDKLTFRQKMWIIGLFLLMLLLIYLSQQDIKKRVVLATSRPPPNEQVAGGEAGNVGTRLSGAMPSKDGKEKGEATGGQAGGGGGSAEDPAKSPQDVPKPGKEPEKAKNSGQTGVTEAGAAGSGAQTESPDGGQSKGEVGKADTRQSAAAAAAAGEREKFIARTGERPAPMLIPVPPKVESPPLDGPPIVIANLRVTTNRLGEREVVGEVNNQSPLELIEAVVTLQFLSKSDKKVMERDINPLVISGGIFGDEAVVLGPGKTHTFVIPASDIPTTWSGKVKAEVKHYKTTQ